MLSTVALSSRESKSPSEKQKGTPQVYESCQKKPEYTQKCDYKKLRQTLSESIAVVDEFLGSTKGELVVYFFKTLIGRVHTLCQGTTLVFTCNTHKGNTIKVCLLFLFNALVNLTTFTCIQKQNSHL